MINREPGKIAEYWKVCGVYRRALKIYMDANMFSNALQLMYEQEWYDEGLRLAGECIRLAKDQNIRIAEEEQRMHERLVNFAVQKARSMLKQKTYTCMCPCIDNDTIAIKNLQYVCDTESLSKWHPISHLLLRCLKENITLDKVMHKPKYTIDKLAYKNQFFGGSKCKAAMQVVIDACYDAYNYANRLKKELSGDEEKHLFYDVMHFYGIEQHYVVPSARCIWMKKIKTPDLDGMVQLDAKETNGAIVKYLESFPVQYLQDTEMEQLLKNMTDSDEESIRSSLLPETTFKQHLYIHINWLHYCCFMRRPTRQESIQQLLNTLHVYGSFQINIVRHDRRACSKIYKWFQSKIQSLQSHECQTDLWFALWKASLIICEGNDELKQKASDICTELQDKKKPTNVLCSIQVPDSNSEEMKVLRVHYFSLWMDASNLIYKDIFNASQLIIDKFLAHIIKVEIVNQSEQVDTKLLMTILEMMTIYATGLLCMIASRACAHVVIVPTYYQYAIDALESDQSHSLSNTSSEPKVSVEELMQLLSNLLNVLIHDSDGILRIVLRQSDGPTSCHYLILALTILGNMENPQFFQKLKDMITKECLDFVARDLSVEKTDDIFTLTEYLLNQFYPYMRGLSQIKYNRTVKFVPYDLPASREIAPQKRECSIDDSISETVEREKYSTSESESDQEDNYNEDDYTDHMDDAETV